MVPMFYGIETSEQLTLFLWKFDLQQESDLRQCSGFCLEIVVQNIDLILTGSENRRLKDKIDDYFTDLLSVETG